MSRLFYPLTYVKTFAMGGQASTNKDAIKKSRPDSTGGRPFQRVEYTWLVRDLDIMDEKPGKEILSEVLELDIGEEKDRWQIALYPAGYNKRLEGFVCVWLKRLSAHERSVRFACSVKDTDIPKKVIQQRLTVETGLGWPAFCHRRTIAEANLLDLELLCVLDVFDDDESLPNGDFKGVDFDKVSQELSVDLEKLLDKGTLADFKIVARGVPFKVHRCVLGARSSVFRAMFRSEIDKGKDGADIDDVSVETMGRLLRFLYSGHLGHLDLPMAESLLYAADKYDLKTLQKMCSKVLRKGLAPENSIHILLVAELHRDERLKDAAIRHIASNIKLLYGGSEFAKLMEEQSKLAQLVLEHVTK